jgi:diguanylate cyclase (GGDEF)-like protein
MKIAPLDQELRQKLPSPHGVAMAIMTACKRDDATIEEIAQLVQNDPALLGRLLKVANAATHGGRPVASAQEAVSRLGLGVVKQVALTFSLVEQHGRGLCTEFDYQGYWSQSLVTALVMRELCPALRLGVPDELFTLGLLARVGTLALATSYPVEYAEILRQAPQGGDLRTLERSRLDIDHLQLSAALLKDWGIPEVLIAPVHLIETPPDAQAPDNSRSDRLSRALHLALQVAAMARSTQAQRADQLASLAGLSASLGFSVEEVGALIDRALEQSQFWSELLKVQVAPAPFFDKLSAAPVPTASTVDDMRLRILIVEDEPILLKLLELWLQDDVNHIVMTATDGKQALGVALQFEPHIVLTDWRMPNMTGVELCTALRTSEWGQNIYVVMLTAADQEDELVEAFDAGVDEYITKPINRRAFTARLKGATRYVRLREAWERDRDRLTQMASELALSNRRHQLASLTDQLTGISNRRAGQQALAQAISASTRYGHPTTILSLDIDHFKRVNDSLGHAAGDTVLMAVASMLEAQARTEDTVCRWGGEEFLIVAPNILLADGVAAARRIVKTIAEQQIVVDGQRVHITLSVGVASWQQNMKNADELILCADNALYAVKSSGRNGVAQADGKTLQRV